MTHTQTHSKLVSDGDDNFLCCRVFKQSGVRRGEFVLNATAGNKTLAARQESRPQCLAACFHPLRVVLSGRRQKGRGRRSHWERSGRQVEKSKTDILLFRPYHIVFFLKASWRGLFIFLFIYLFIIYWNYIRSLRSITRAQRKECTISIFMRQIQWKLWSQERQGVEGLRVCCAAAPGEREGEKKQMARRL